MEKEEEIEVYKYVCGNCKFKCNFKSQWDIHIVTELHRTGKRKKRSDYKEPQKCDICDYKTKNTITFIKHTLNEHATKKERKEGFKYYCEYCDFGTFSNDTMNLHNETKKHKKQLMRQK